MKLVVLGATGGTGQHVVAQALAKGHEVTAMVRDPAKVQTKHERLRVVSGDVTNAADLEKVLSGADAVISAVGPREKNDPICARAAEAVVAAMKKTGVRRVVWTSASGVGDSLGPITTASWIFGKVIIPLLLKKPYENHFKAEETLRASGLDFTVARPLQLVDKKTSGAVTANLGDQKLGGLKIAREDVAAFLVEEAVSPKYTGKMPMIHA